MIFVSTTFWGVFLVTCLLLEANARYGKSVRLKNLTLLSASYALYSLWDWKFLGLIVLVSLQTYMSAILIERNRELRKLILVSSIFINLGILAYFKYWNFFVSELVDAFGVSESYLLKNIILPVGISFYVFQSLSYVIDVFMGKIEVEHDPIKYMTFVAFFPQLVAGPIERASTLLPQFSSVKRCDASDLYLGVKIVILGLFLKIFLADGLAVLVDPIFSSYQDFNGGTLFLAAIGFGFQIYCDFAGYSYLAVGTARMLGINLTSNFNSPYLSLSLQEFWRRWHITLGKYFRDYVYLPLGGSRDSDLNTSRNIMITFLLSGLWHGANWTFVLWGFAHGLALIVSTHLKINTSKCIRHITTISFVFILWILFRSESISDFITFISIMILDFGVPEVSRSLIILVLYAVFLDLLIWRFKASGDTWFGSSLKESMFFAVMFIAVVGTIRRSENAFIYFQF